MGNEAAIEDLVPAAAAAAQAREKRIRELVELARSADELALARDEAKEAHTALVEEHKAQLLAHKTDLKEAAKRLHLAQQRLLPAQQALDELRVLADPDRILKRAANEARVRVATFSQELVDARKRLQSTQIAVDDLAKDTSDPPTLEELRKTVSRLSVEVRELEASIAKATADQSSAEAARERAFVALLEAHRPKGRAAK